MCGERCIGDDVIGGSEAKDGFNRYIGFVAFDEIAQRSMFTGGIDGGDRTEAASRTAMFPRRAGVVTATAPFRIRVGRIHGPADIQPSSPLRIVRARRTSEALLPTHPKPSWAAAPLSLRGLIDLYDP